MKDAQPKALALKDYRVPDFLIDHTDLTFDLDPSRTCVTSRLSVRRNPESIATSDAKKAPLVLHGQEIELKSVALNGDILPSSDYICDENTLTLPNVPDAFELTCIGYINPEANTSLEGLYKSRTMFCTQCEAEGFRKITYYLDRPDVMSEFTTTLIADKQQFPVLLSNGNCVAKGDSQENPSKHFATWHDPFKKPAYLFAVVAGDLSVVEDTFTTMSGRNVDLKIFVEPKDLDKCDHAMNSLKASMVWDEKVYGREYDLDIFMIVAVDDFNMGAMENKGLNIFNTSCVLANPKTTTDGGFQRVEAVVAHEYFHNWSGNRVTCRDWFQLSLKEGFTVFRDSEFSADQNSRTVKRIEDVKVLKALQFAEDAGPMAHPVQPPTYIEISNFYTLTIYEKGAEIVRMIHTLLGPDLFRKGSDLYFDRHDGQAVTIEDFVRAMSDVSGRDFTQFMHWYRQAGTPVVTVEEYYDAEQQTYDLTFSQHCPTTPEATQEQKQPYVIPLALGLVGEQGDLVLQLKDTQPNGSVAEQSTHHVFELTQAKETLRFVNVTERPVPSLFRGFSAPIRVEASYSRSDYARLLMKDSDGYNRWDASQQLSTLVIQDAIHDYQAAGEITQAIDPALVAAHRHLLQKVLSDPQQTEEDWSLMAYMLQLPSEIYLSEIAEQIDAQAIYRARLWVSQQLAKALFSEWRDVYQLCLSDESFEPNAQQIARRTLKFQALIYLMASEEKQAAELAWEQFNQADNMTDQLSALTVLSQASSALVGEYADKALSAFYQQWQHEALVVNHWLSVQASAPQEGALERVKALTEHPAFTNTNPNKVRALLGGFCNGNLAQFHCESGSGYAFLTDQILTIDGQNPQLASRLVTPLTRWKKYSEPQGEKMREQLQRIFAHEGLSKDVYEVVSKSL